jgi:triosephosphate isomerase
MRAALRARFGEEAEGIRLLYGGSVKPENAGTILTLANVDGALVGGASLKAASFIAIARAYL